MELNNHESNACLFLGKTCTKTQFSTLRLGYYVLWRHTILLYEFINLELIYLELTLSIKILDSTLESGFLKGLPSKLYVLNHKRRKDVCTF